MGISTGYKSYHCALKTMFQVFKQNIKTYCIISMPYLGNNFPYSHINFQQKPIPHLTRKTTLQTIKLNAQYLFIYLYFKRLVTKSIDGGTTSLQVPSIFEVRYLRVLHKERYCSVFNRQLNILEFSE